MVELKPAVLTKEYIKEWNIYNPKLYNIYVDGVKKSDKLYTMGVFPANLENPYFLILLHREALYELHIEANPEKRKHLESVFTIITNKGEVKKEFNSFNSPYLLGGLIYVLNNSYYNIETGEKYLNTSHSINTENYLFLDNRYDSVESRKGVMQLDKRTGTYTIIN